MTQQRAFGTPLGLPRHQPVWQQNHSSCFLVVLGSKLTPYPSDDNHAMCVLEEKGKTEGRTALAETGTQIFFLPWDTKKAGKEK